MQSVRERGVDEALQQALHAGTPILGICLGMQISLDHSEESDTQTLGILPGEVQRFRFDRADLKVPHMGWNEVRVVKPHPVLDGIEPGDEFYFVHGYFPAPREDEHVYAETDYERTFASAIGRDNYLGTQFHPEKSGRVGLRLLAKFAQWKPSC